MKGFDQTTNLILTQSHERVFSIERPVSVVQLGLYIIRGDSMYVNFLFFYSRFTIIMYIRALVGEIDEEKEETIDYEHLKALPINPIIH